MSSWALIPTPVTFITIRVLPFLSTLTSIPVILPSTVMPPRPLGPEMKLFGEIWTTRPAFPATQTFELDVKYTGKSAGEKLAEVRKAMQAEGADTHIITRVDDIAWLLNMRADDDP